MAVASASTYNLTAQDIIDLALADISALGPGKASAGSMRDHGLKLLNVVLKQLDAEGVIQASVSRRTQSLTSGTASYVLTNDVSDIDGPGRYTVSGATYGSQVTPMARDEYMGVPDRTIQGVSMRYYVEKGLDANGVQQITVILYPVPPNTGDSFEYAAVVRMRDVLTLAQNVSLAQTWLNAAVLGLAARLAIPYGLELSRVALLSSRFETAKEKAMDDGAERGDMQLVPFGNSTYGHNGPRSW